MKIKIYAAIIIIFVILSVVTACGIRTPANSATSGGGGGTPSTSPTATLQSIIITPASTISPSGTTQNFIATATYSDNSTGDMTNLATWVSSIPSIASTASGGVISCLSNGTTNITAKLNGITSNIAVLTVGGTNASGAITTNTTWTLANSPYIVTSDVIVNAGVILTIQPGVIVQFKKNKSMLINGTLIARGTALSQITFTSSNFPPATGDWGYIYFGSNSTSASYDVAGNYLAGSIIEYSIIEYAGGKEFWGLPMQITITTPNLYGAIAISNTYPFINYSTIKNNNGVGLCIDDLASPNTIKITNTSISQNKGGGILIANLNFSPAQAIISNNNISNNIQPASIFWRGGYGISASNLSTIISNNIITGNNSNIQGGGIFIDRCNANISYNTIVNNVTNSQGGGIYGTWSTLTIASNTISNNQGSLGGGLFLKINTSNINHNIISGNLAQDGSGIVHEGMLNVSSVLYNSISNNITTVASSSTIFIPFGNPSIVFNNITSNIATYDLYFNDALSLDATNNWWGTAVNSQISAKIYSNYIAPGVGIVTYTPFASAAVVGAP